MSALAQSLRKHKILVGSRISCDAAYVGRPGLVTPWSRTVLRGEDAAHADAFNFYNSSHRIHVEQAFGMRFSGSRYDSALNLTDLFCQLL